MLQNIDDDIYTRADGRFAHTCAISIQHCRVMGILYANCGFFTVGLVVVTGGVVGRADKDSYQARKRLD